jgi:hypothetical protein
MTKEKDIVLIYLEDQPITFARLESISPDIKKDWYHVKLLMLQVPLQVTTWILRDVYISGQEFTMGGKRVRKGWKRLCALKIWNQLKKTGQYQKNPAIKR